MSSYRCEEYREEGQVILLEGSDELKQLIQMQEDKNRHDHLSAKLSNMAWEQLNADTKTYLVMVDREGVLKRQHLTASAVMMLY